MGQNFEAVMGGNSGDMHVQKWTTTIQGSLMESTDMKYKQHLEIEINLRHKMMILSGCFKVREVL